MFRHLVSTSPDGLLTDPLTDLLTDPLTDLRADLLMGFPGSYCAYLSCTPLSLSELQNAVKWPLFSGRINCKHVMTSFPVR